MLDAISNSLKQRPVLADLLALLAGAVYPLAFSPFDLWLFGIVSILLLLFATRDAAVWRGAVRFYLFGIGMYIVGASWIYVSIHEHGNASPLLASCVVALAVVGVSLPMLLQGYLYQRYFRWGNIGLVIGFPALWTAKEWLYTWFLTGFPWLFAGYGHLETPLAGYAPFIGVLGVGFTLILSSCLIFLLINATNLRQRLFGAGLTVLIWSAGFGLSRVELVSETGKDISVSIVQGNIDQKIKWRKEMMWPIVRTYVDMSSDEWGRQLVVWPEAAIPIFKEVATDLLSELDARARATGTTLVLGIPDRDDEGNFLNSAIAIGVGEGEYIKRRLVPFGEYVPLEGLLRGLIELFDLPMSHNKTGPWIQPPLRAPGLSLAMTICYEVVYPDLVRSNAEIPDLLITISNDSWFGDSLGPLQHMQMARMRALENGRYLIRATNDGVSALVDHKGVIVNRLPRFEPGVLRGNVKKMSGTTPFVQYGHTPILVLIVFLLMGQWIWQHRGIR